MKDKTNIFKKFIGSISNIKVFPKYIKEGLGRAVVYALLLMLFVGAIKGIFLNFQLNSYFDSAKAQLNESKYRFEIKDGVLDLQGNEVIDIDDGSSLVYVNDEVSIDEKDQIENLVIHNDSYVLFLKDGIIVNSQDLGEQSAKYSDIMIDNETFDNSTIINYLSYAKYIIIIATVFGSIFYYFMNSVLIAVMSMASNMIMRLGMKFSDILSLVFYAGTLPIIVQTIFEGVMPSIYFGYVSIVGTVIYVFLILRNIRKEINDGMNVQ